MLCKLLCIGVRVAADVGVKLACGEVWKARDLPLLVPRPGPGCCWPRSRWQHGSLVQLGLAGVARVGIKVGAACVCPWPRLILQALHVCTCMALHTLHERRASAPPPVLLPAAATKAANSSGPLRGSGGFTFLSRGASSSSSYSSSGSNSLHDVHCPQMCGWRAQGRLLSLFMARSRQPVTTPFAAT